MTARQPVQQALYGYDRGHRLLASSTAIDGAAGRLLRSVTDMAFEEGTQHYLTALPVESLHAYALIRSWPAGEDRRPGSVWSHVLLIDLVEVGDHVGLAQLVSLFRHPADIRESKSADEVDFGPYELPIPLATYSEPSTIRKKDELIAVRVLKSVYLPRDRSWVECKELEVAETVLLAVWEQQWSRLRRSFSFRTRLRPSESTSFSFSIEVVQRGPRGPAPAKKSEDDWVRVLASDLLKPDSRFRRTLRLVGAGNSQLDQVAQIVSICEALLSGTTAPTLIVQEIAHRFPDSSEMRPLKRLLFGPVGDDRSLHGLWPEDEAVRIGLLLHAQASFLDVDDLMVGERLADLWETRPEDALLALTDFETGRQSPQLLEVVCDVTARAAPAKYLGRLGAKSPDLTREVIRRRPDILVTPTVWRGDQNHVEELIRLVAESPHESRRRVFFSLVKTNSVDAASRVCALDPEMWWEALEHFSSTKSAKQRQKIALALKSILDDLGAAAVGPPLGSEPTSSVMLMVAMATDLRAGVWRRFAVEQWVSLAGTFTSEDSPPRNLAEDPASLRVLAISLAAGSSSGSASLRKKAWSEGFGVLHSALAEATVDEEAWAVLSRLLPRAEQWDRCASLRRGLAREIALDQWSQADVEAVLDATPEYKEEVIRAATKGKKGRSLAWLRDLLERLAL